MEAVISYQQKQQEDNQPKGEMVKEFEKELFSPDTPSSGSGPIKVAYFFDFNCGHCKRQSETNKAVLAEGKVQIFYKNYAVLGPSSELAAKAALSAHQQGKYQEFYEEAHKSRTKDLASLKGIAKKLKLDVAKWEQDMEGEAVKKELDATNALAKKMKVRGTPFIAIAPDKVFPGRVDSLSSIINSL